MYGEELRLHHQIVLYRCDHSVVLLCCTPEWVMLECEHGEYGGYMERDR